MPPLPSLALTYFDFGGRVEPVRAAMRLAHLPFVDNRISFDALPALKPIFPYGKMPVLDVDTARFAECQGILRYVGRLGGMYPPAEDEVAAMLVDEILDTFEEFVWTLIAPSFHEKDPAKVLQMREALVAGPLPTALAKIDARLETIAAIYPPFKDGVYIHDVVVWDNFVNFESGMLEGVPTSLIGKYKTMKMIHDKVAARLLSPQSHTPLRVSTPVFEGEPLMLKLCGGGRHMDTIRLVLKIGGVAFEDNPSLTNAKFEAGENASPDGQEPTILVGNRVVARKALAILRFVGTLAGLYPATDFVEAMKVDEVIGHLYELEILVAVSSEEDLQRKRKAGELLARTTIPEFLGSLDKRLGYWKSEPSCKSSVFALGGPSITLADFMIHSVVRLFKTGEIVGVQADIADVYTHLMQSHEAIAFHPRVKAFYEED